MARFVCAIEDPPGLVLVDGDGAVVPFPAGAVAGHPRFPARACDGRLACTCLLDAGVGGEWTTALAVLDADGVLADMLPGALWTAPPAWSPSGRLAFLRGGRNTADRELVVYEPDGAEGVVTRDPALRAVAWLDEETVLVSTGASLLRWSLADGRRLAVFRHAVGESFLRYGTDDLYVTLEQASAGGAGRLAITVRWHEQGRAGRERVHVLADGDLVAVGASPRSRFPRWRGAALLVTAPGGLEVLAAAPDAGTTVAVPGLHSAEWWAGGEASWCC